MSGYRISERTLKSGKVAKTVIIDREKVTQDDMEIIKEFYVPAGYTVKYKAKGITSKDIVAYIEKHDSNALEHFKKALKDDSFMKVKAEFKAAYPDYPKAPANKK